MLQKFFLSGAKSFLSFWLLVSSSALIFAYFVEYVLGFTPCILCLYQRWPYYIIVIISILGMSFKQLQNPALLLITLCLITGASIAFYHSGVERGIFEGTAQCHGGQLEGDLEDLDNLEEQLYATEASDCTVPPFKVIGLSMTEWNLVFNILLIWLMQSYYKTTRKYVFKDK